MTNKEAMEIVLKLAELGDSIAQVKGLDGKRLTDREREEYPEAIYQMQDYKNDLMAHSSIG
jgi:chorismate mutase